MHEAGVHRTPDRPGRARRAQLEVGTSADLTVTALLRCTCTLPVNLEGTHLSLLLS